MVSVNVGYTITITSGDMETIHRVRGKLIDDYNIDFDTGTHSEGHDWFLDWSLKHSDEISREEAITHIKKSLDQNNLKYKVKIETYTDN
jgi:hypothetical protein